MAHEQGHGDLLAPKDARKLLQCSQALLRKYERQGRLHPYVNPDGVHMYHRAEIVAVAAKRQVTIGRIEGELAARVFYMFEEGRTLSEIVQATHQSPLTIRALHDEWKRPLGAPTTAEEERRRREDDARDDQASETIARRRNAG